MKPSRAKQLILLLIAGSLVLFMVGLGAGIWIARNKVASQEQEVNRHLTQDAGMKFQMGSVDTNTPPVVKKPPPNNHEQKTQQITCLNNLKQIGLGFRLWAGDNADIYPFNLSTNVGGTLELCNLDKDGLDQNAALHFQMISNELYAPNILVCPGDSSKKVAANFLKLTSENVYSLYTGRNLEETNSSGILITCPIDGNTLYSDGHVIEGSKR